MGLLSFRFRCKPKLLPELLILNLELIDNFPFEDLRRLEIWQSSGCKSMVLVADLMLILRDFMLEVLYFLDIVVEVSDLAVEQFIVLLKLLDPGLSIP